MRIFCPLKVQKAIPSFPPCAFTVSFEISNFSNEEWVAPKSAPLGASGVLRALSFQVDAVE